MWASIASILHHIVTNIFVCLYITLHIRTKILQTTSLLDSICIKSHFHISLMYHRTKLVPQIFLFGPVQPKRLQFKGLSIFLSNLSLSLWVTSIKQLSSANNIHHGKTLWIFYVKPSITKTKQNEVIELLYIILYLQSL